VAKDSVAKDGAAKDGAAKDGAARGERPPYEQARDELAELVKRLEAGGLTLEQSLELWERGERLAAVCEEWLEGARARLAAAMADREDGTDRARQGLGAAAAAPEAPF